MKHETKLQIQAALAKRGWTHAAQVINEFVEALESTDEQKALRADAERWRHFSEFFGLANPDDDSITWHPEAIAATIDKAREA